MTEDWGGLQERMRSLATLENLAAAPAVGLAAHAAVLLHGAWERVIGQPLQWVAADLGPQLERVRLAQAAGETDRARAMALATRAWLRRAADDLDRRLATMIGLNLIAGRMVVSDAWVRRLAASDELSPEQRSALLDRLAAADADLRETKYFLHMPSILRSYRWPHPVPCVESHHRRNSSGVRVIGGVRPLPDFTILAA